jgi:alpha-beta hydrolase superfamily lysophospholipase/thiol-disulfide isomerase/thioredoxin
MKIDSTSAVIALVLSICIATHPPGAWAKRKSAEKADKSVYQTTTDAGQADAHAAPCICWINPLIPTQAVLLCIHGLGLNSDAYTNFGRHMSRLGIATYAIDVRGFGSWMKAQGHAKLDFEGTLLDIKQALQAIRKANAGLPVFLLGESMGGAIALRACSIYPELIDGLISSVPAGDRFQQKRTDLDVAFHFLEGPHKQFDIGNQIVDQATQSDQLREVWESDPLNRMDLSADELIQFQRFMNENHDAVKKIDRTPVLMVQGTLDKLVKPEGTWELFEKLPSTQKTFVALPSEHLVFEEGRAKSARYDQKAARLVAAWIFSTLNSDPQIGLETRISNKRAGDNATTGGSIGISSANSASAGSENSPANVQQPINSLSQETPVNLSASDMSSDQSPVIALCEQGKYGEARSGLESIVHRQPLNGDAHYWLGMCYRNLNRPQLAFQEFVLARSLAQASGQSKRANDSLLDLANGSPNSPTPHPNPAIAAMMGGKPTVLIFWASWCAECQDLNKTIRQAHQVFGDSVQIKKVDIDDQSNADLVKIFSVGPIPTYIFVKANGSVGSTLIGLTSYANFAKATLGILR